MPGTQGQDVKDALHEVAGRLDYPMFILTTHADGELSGCLIGFMTQCSVDPVRFVICVSDKNHTHAVALRAGALAVHLVPEGEVELARLFGEHTGDDIDKFSRCSWEPGLDGVPLLRACPDRFEAAILDRIEAGDHTAFIVEPRAASAGRRDT